MGMLYPTMEDNGINLAKSIKLAICDLILAILSEYHFGIAKIRYHCNPFTFSRAKFRSISKTVQKSYLKKILLLSIFFKKNVLILET